jgi:hypothetical protein
MARLFGEPTAHARMLDDIARSPITSRTSGGVGMRLNDVAQQRQRTLRNLRITERLGLALAAFNLGLGLGSSQVAWTIVGGVLAVVSITATVMRGRREAFG